MAPRQEPAATVLNPTTAATSVGRPPSAAFLAFEADATEGAGR